MISGRHVRLRPIEAADLRFLQELGNDPAVRGSVVGWDWPLSEHGQARWLEATADDSRNRRFVIIDEGDLPIGLTGLWDIDWHNRNALTAVKLYEPRLERRGLGTDAIKTMMAYAFYEVGLVRLWGQMLPFNVGSFGAYCRKCNWKVEGRSRQHVWRDGRFHDLIQVGALREDFDALPDAQEYRRLGCPVDTSLQIDTA